MMNRCVNAILAGENSHNPIFLIEIITVLLAATTLYIVGFEDSPSSLLEIESHLGS